MESDKIRAAIRQARVEKGLTRDQMGERLGVSAKTILRWETGSRKITTEILEAVAKATDYTVDDLIKGGGGVNGKGDTTRLRGNGLLIPLFTRAALICAGGGNILPMPESEEHLWINEAWAGGPLGPKRIYAAILEGTSMEPEIPDGSTIVVNPNAEVRSGDIAVVCLDDRTMTKIVYFRDDGVELVPINSGYQRARFSQAECEKYSFSVQGKVVYTLKGKVPHGGY
jgi:repressor LexA